ncbi:hypothetical protein ABZ329_07710 [Streptomyces rubiginosohelvolus]|uniref:hypothetical protein n=1 Tax=Streptomyces rubiginosohelvolus TaxID=67362 RepID=UPI00340115D7
MATWVQASSPIRDSARAATTWYGVESPAMPRPVTEGSGTGGEGVGDKGVGGVVTAWSAPTRHTVPLISAWASLITALTGVAVVLLDRL